MSRLRYRRVLRVYQDTSRTALESVWATLPAVDAAIMRCITAGNGCTSNEIERATGLRHQTVSAQIRHMAEAGLLVDGGARRRSDSGRACVVWTLAPAQPALF